MLCEPWDGIFLILFSEFIGEAIIKRWRGSRLGLNSPVSMGTAREPRDFLVPDGFCPCKVQSHNRVTALTSWQVLEEPWKEREGL